MIAALVDGHVPGVDITHVPMRFSKSIGELGSVRAGKVAHLAEVIERIVAARLRKRYDILYFPPSGPSTAAMIRDAAILLATRRLFPRIVLHFHSGHLSELLADLPVPLRLLADKAYGRPDAAIILSERLPRDDQLVNAARTFTVPNGIPDEGAPPDRAHRAPGPPRLLFLTALSERKGLFVLLEAARLLVQRGARFELVLAGEIRPSALRPRVEALLASTELRDVVRTLGVVTGEAKRKAFLDADIFAFPSFYETQSVAVMEAMMFGLPVVAARSGAMEDLVDQGRSGLLVPARDPQAFADALHEVISDPERAREMGRVGRARFEAQFTIAQHLNRMGEVFQAIAAEPSTSRNR
jgi:glycosyltransferase involved in cell wall biosynthesis